MPAVPVGMAKVGMALAGTSFVTHAAEKEVGLESEVELDREVELDSEVKLDSEVDVPRL